MGLLARQLVQQLTRKQSFCRYMSALSSTATTMNGEQKPPNSKWNSKTNYAIGLCTGIVGYSLLKDYFDYVIPEVSAAVPMSKRSQFNFIADVVEDAAKALVFIEIQDTRRMDYLSGKPMTVSNGSGFIVDSNGLILTNAHVVTNKPRSIVSVKLSDGRVFIGMVEAIDPVSDLATVRIQCKNLPALKLGASSSLRAGEFVIALGSPLCKFSYFLLDKKFKPATSSALSNTVTSGVVSSTQRNSKELGLQGRDINYIQTDAAITFGNSGGPLVNLDGEAVGINSMKVTAGISFAIPIDYAKNFLKLADEKVKKGKPNTPTQNRRYMGITMLTLTPQIIAELKQRGSLVPEAVVQGILVWKVILNSPAHVSGLSAGDIILQINGKDVTQSAEIYETLETNVKTLSLVVLRNGQLLSISVVPENPE